MRTIRFTAGLLAFSAVLLTASGCWKGPFPGDGGELPGSFTCTDDYGTTDHRPSGHRFVGTWNWIQSCGGIAGWCSSPESVGYEQRLHLSPRGSYTMCRDTDTVEEGHYLIEFLDPRNRIHFMRPDRDTVRTLFIELAAPDTLLLDEGCCDMFAHLYARD